MQCNTDIDIPGSNATDKLGTAYQIKILLSRKTSPDGERGDRNPPTVPNIMR